MQINFKNYTEHQKLYKEGDNQPSLVLPFPILWVQYNQLNYKSDLESTPDCEQNPGEDLSLVAN